MSGGVIETIVPAGNFPVVSATDVGETANRQFVGSTEKAAIGRAESGISALPAAPARTALFMDQGGNVPLWLVNGLLEFFGITGAAAKKIADAVAGSSTAARVLSNSVGLSTLPASSKRVPFGGIDDSGNIPAFLDEQGRMEVVKGLGPKMTASLTATVLASLGQVSTPATKQRVPVLIDEAGNVPLWIEGGKLAAYGVSTTLLNSILTSVMSSALQKFAPRNAPLATALPIATDGRSLRQWRARLAARKQSGTGKAKLMFFGDSWSEFLPIPQALASLLYSDHGAAGGGWISVNSNGASLTRPLDAATFAKSGGWTLFDAGTASAVQPLPAFGCGHDGMAISTNLTTQNCTWTFTGTEFRLFYPSTTGSFRYRADGGAWTTVTGDGSNSLQVLVLGALGAGQHTIELDTSPNTATVAIFGAYFTTAAGVGVEVLKCGNGSLDSAELASYVATNVAGMIGNLAPDVIVVPFCTNDYRTPAATVAVFTSTWTALVSAVRATLPNVGFLFIAPADTNGIVASAPLSAYRDAMASFCLAGGHEFYNQNEDWSSWAVENARGQFTDDLHQSDVGAYRTAARVKRLFLDL